MDIRGYITSGILELYVNGLTTPEEGREVEEMAAQHPEIQQEIDAIRETMEQYVRSHEIQPPADLKGKIMQRIEGTPGARPKPHPAEGAPAAAFKTHGKEKGQGGKAAIVLWLLALGMIAAAVTAYLFFEQNRKSQETVAETQAQFEQFRQECEERQKNEDALKEQFIALRHQATRPVQMRGTDLAKDALAVVYWNDVRRVSYLDVVNMPVAPAGKQYQLWAIVDGKPADMGVFDITTEGTGLQPVPFVENPQAFAVTLEPAGGSVNPTLDQMYVVGNVVRG